MSPSCTNGGTLASSRRFELKPPHPSARARWGLHTGLAKPAPIDNRILMALFASVLVAFACAVVFRDSYDNDIWFILATGEEIAKNGIPYANPFSFHEEPMGFIAQQWLVCLAYYHVYQAFGFIGLGVVTLVLALALMGSMYFVGRFVRGDGSGGEVLLALMIPVVYGMSSYMSVRPHLYSMLAFVWVVYFMERYRRASQARWLAALLPLVMLHVNLHAAMAPFDLVIIGCYLVPDVLAPFHKRGRLMAWRFERSSYPRLPILVALLACALCLLANPYGLDGALYLVHSYGYADYKGYISEMANMAPASSAANIVITLVVFVTAVCVGARGASRIDLPLVLLVCGTACLAFMHIRNRWLVVLFCFLLLAVYSRGRTIRPFARSRSVSIVVPTICALGLIACIGGVFFALPVLVEEPKNDYYTPVNAMDYLDRIGADKETTRVFTFFNAGGYIEYRGYKVNIDPRPELWGASIAGTGFDYYKEYVDMAKGDAVFNDYIERYDFDVFIIPTNDNSTTFFSGNWDYVEIPGGEGYLAYASKERFSRDAS